MTAAHLSPAAAVTCAGDCASSTPLTSQRRAYLRHGLMLAGLTAGWNIVEGLVAVAAGLAAGSIALTGFGADSFVETASGAVMLWRLRAELAGQMSNEAAERRAVRLIAVTLFLLAGYVAVESARDLLAGGAAEPSTTGLILTALSLVVMPLLARAKRRHGRAMGSPSLVADSRQTDLCSYLSATVFVGLAVNALFGWQQADAVAALGVAVIALWEGLRAWRTRDLCTC